MIIFAHSAGRAQAQGGTRAQKPMRDIAQPENIQIDSGATVLSGEFDLKEAEKILSQRAVELVRAEFEQRTWEAWWKTAVEGRPAADVAAEMGMSLAAVYKAKSRVLLRLRQELRFKSNIANCKLNKRKC